MADSSDNKSLLRVCDNLVASSQSSTKSAVQVKNISKTLQILAQSQNTKITTALNDANQINSSLESSVLHLLEVNTNLTQLFESLVDKARSLDNIQQLINDIKDSTNTIDLLAFQSKMVALNATIEAVRIGAAGKSFRVVADEMKKLANTTENASADINSTIDSTAKIIKAQVQDSLRAAESGLKDIKESHEAIEQLKAIYSNHQTDQQKSLTQEVNIQKLIDSFSQLTEISADITSSSDQLSHNSDNLNNEVEVTNGLISDLIGEVENAPIVNIKTKQAQQMIKDHQFQLIDVRRQDEYCDELGHIEGAKLITLDENFKSNIKHLNQSKQYLFICRSGGRSARAAREAQDTGFTKIFNLEGGMLAWNKASYPTEK